MGPVSRFEAVLFDMDGVLVDSEPHWQQFWRETVFADAERGTPTLSEVTGRNYRESLREIDAEYGLREDLGRYERRFEAAAEGIYGAEVAPMPGVGSLFEDLRDRGRVGVVSSAPREWIETVVDRFDLDPLGTVVSAEDIDGPGKPDPTIYRVAADRLGVTPEDCVVVEDSVNGVEAAADAGATVFRFQLEAEGTEPPSAGADAVVADSAALGAELRSLLGGPCGAD